MNFLKYSLLRLLFSAAAFFASYYFGVGFILAIIFGALIIGFLIKEPNGLAALLGRLRRTAR